MKDEGNFRCSLCENQYSYKGTLKTHIMIKHCKCLSFDCDQCRQHLTQSLNMGCEKQQAVRSDKEEGFERLQDIPHQSESFKNTPFPNGIHKLFQPKPPSLETKDLKRVIQGVLMKKLHCEKEFGPVTQKHTFPLKMEQMKETLQKVLENQQEGDGWTNCYQAFFEENKEKLGENRLTFGHLLQTTG